MLKRLDLRGSDLSSADLAAALPRAALDVEAALERVRPILEDVRTRGAHALLELAERFDGVRPEHLRVPAEALTAALDRLDPEVRVALETAVRHTRAGHTAQLPAERSTQILPGGVVHQRWVPVRRVGLYVPGGLAVYPSSVVMNVVAAQVAGVEELVVTSPPQRDFGGLPHPLVLAACALLGVAEVYAVGGAQGIGMLAHGVAGLCPPVDVVTGPGNVYVAAAKRAVRGVVGIDAEAGTTEIAVLADGSADPRHAAADLISQAEHDPAAASVLITDSVALADAVDAEVDRQAARTAHTERVRTALTGPQSGIVLVRDLAQGVAVADAYAAEHLEIHTADAGAVARRIRNAGAIFVGPYAPVPLGDYVAGSNHVLPTGGTARFAGGLSVMAFLKPVQLVEYDRLALAELAGPLAALAHAEDLPAHADAVRARLTEPGPAASPGSADAGPDVTGSRGTPHGTAPVLVGTDGSTQARLAVQWAAAEAARRGTRLHVLYAYPWLARATGWEIAPSQEALAEARQVAEAAAREASGVVEATSEVVVEDPAVALVRRSATAALVVVGARGRTGGVGPHVGAQARGVVENAHCDVVVVRAHVPADGPVVVGMDPRDHSPHALAYAFADAERRGVRVVVVQALAGRHTDADPAAEEELRRWRERHPGVKAQLHQVDAEPAEALLEASPGASIVVVGHTRRGGLLSTSVGRAVIPRLPVVAVAHDPAED